MMAADPGSLCPRESRCDSEQDRIRDLSRYYCTFKQDPQSPSPSLSPDTTLTALTKLGVYRFGCNRAFVSIIDGNHQHLISEATVSVSLCKADHHLKDDGIYLGVRTLDLEWGVCPHAIRLFTGQDPSRVTDTENITANRTRNIIRDFTSEDFYKNRPYVVEWPHFRFYAEVPLYSPSGYVLGSYCVVDNKTRMEFGDDEVAALQEIADAISHHLENVRVVQYHRRAEKLVKGLTSFVEGHANPDSPYPSNCLAQPTDALSFHNLNFPDNGIRSKESDEVPASNALGVESGVNRSTSTCQDKSDSCLFSEKKDSELTRPTSQPSSLALGSPDTTELSGPDVYFAESALDDVPVSQRVAAIFSRAHDLLKDSMDLGGVVFLDTSPSDSHFDMIDDLGKFENGYISKLASSKPATNGKPEYPERLCRSLGYSLNSLCNKASDSESKLALPEETLATLIKVFPTGHIFNVEDEPSESETVQRASRQLAHSLPEANSIIFIPLWDWNNSICLAGTLVWSQDKCRPLGKEELHYFKVFGDSIISEVSRIHWRATERSKFNFVSSINHELRSPLHGILGSAELMQSMSLEPSQHHMVKMIEESGLNLLETIDQLLEYCKINDLTTANSESEGISGKPADFDLSALVEEVTNDLCASLNFGSASVLADDATDTSPGMETDRHHPSSEDELSTVVRIEHLDSWTVRSTISAWKRILMNLISNAIKWTKIGLIEVTLSQTRSKANGFPLVHLRVNDTGSGISREYLKNKLFSPFAQVDSISPGVGLGLSIVHKLVTSLGGDINVRSELGVGTQVDVYIPVEWSKNMSAARENVSCSLSERSGLSRIIKACLVGMQGHPDLKETPTGILSVDAKRQFSIQNAVIDVYQRKLGWHVMLAKSSHGGHGDVAIIEESELRKMLHEGRLPTADTRLNSKSLIVLNGKRPFPTDELPANIIRVSQPFGPKSFHDAAEKFMKINRESIQSEATKLPLISSLSITQQQANSLLPQHDSIDKPGTLFSSDTINYSDQFESTLHSDESPPTSLHVLIVDDNDINLKIMSTFVRKIGCHYDTASNGLLALEQYEKSTRPYDFILMDISMPVMDGLVATKKIREYERDHGLKASCILAVTAVASNETQDAAFKAGVNGYLVKPLSLDKFRQLFRVA